MSQSHQPAWIKTIGAREAEGPLRAAYEAMKAGAASRPVVYSPSSGDVPNIIRCHSLDPEGLRLAFAASAAVHWSPGALDWAEREMVNTVVSQANKCRY